MRHLSDGYRGLSIFMTLNVDRFLVPLLIVAALTLAGSMFSYATID